MTPERVPKLCGADIELGNFALGAASGRATYAEAARALLREIDGVPARPGRSSPGHDGGARSAAGSTTRSRRAAGLRLGAAVSRLDRGRRFLPTNGGCAYIDLDHLELCLPEVIAARDHVAAWHAMLRLAQRALADANARRPHRRRIVALVNNSDGRGHSYGSHLDFLITRASWDDIFRRKLHHLAFLAAFQVSSIVFTGQGKVGSENGAPPVGYQICQRADFFESLVGPQTTYERPLVNSRDEPLCGARGLRPGRTRRCTASAAAVQASAAGTPLARLHCIFFDSTLCPVASLLKVGTMQIVLGMLEAGRVESGLALDDPLDAVQRWSHDPTLRARAALVGGSRVTAVELQTAFLESAGDFVASGGCQGLVPGAAEIVELWDDTLQKLRAGDRPALARRLDWVLKQSVLERVLHQRPELAWDSPEIKHLDHQYSSLDPEAGLYWAVAAAGDVDPVVEDAEIERFLREPPADTRAWGRAMLLRHLGASRVASVDWDRIRVRSAALRRGAGAGRFELDDPLGWSRTELGPHLQHATDVDRLLAGRGSRRPRPEHRTARPEGRNTEPTIDNGGGDGIT